MKRTKRFGGALGDEFAALWEAVQRSTIVSMDGMSVDRTTRGAVIRAGSDDGSDSSATSSGYNYARCGDPLQVFGNPVGNRYPMIVESERSSNGLPYLLPTFEQGESLPDANTTGFESVAVIEAGGDSIGVEGLGTSPRPVVFCRRRGWVNINIGAEAAYFMTYSLGRFVANHTGLPVNATERSFQDTGNANSADFIGAFYGFTIADLFMWAERPDFTAAPLCHAVTVDSAELMGLAGISVESGLLVGVPAFLVIKQIP